jgi:hypothetical protein
VRRPIPSTSSSPLTPFARVSAQASSHWLYPPRRLTHPMHPRDLTNPLASKPATKLFPPQGLTKLTGRSGPPNHRRLVPSGNPIDSILVMYDDSLSSTAAQSQPERSRSRHYLAHVSDIYRNDLFLLARLCRPAPRAARGFPQILQVLRHVIVLFGFLRHLQPE